MIKILYNSKCLCTHTAKRKMVQRNHLQHI